VLAAIVDVTERRRLRREIAQRRDELAHLSRVAVLGELSGSLAHELKQPLAAILSSAQAAQRFSRRGAEGLPELEAALADIVEDTKRASDLIDRLRELFRSGATERRALDLNEVVEQVLTIMRSELSARGLILAVSLAADVPKIIGNPVQLQQVLINLIMNAAEAMRHVDPKNQALVVRTARLGSDRVELCVSDTGHGIPAGDLEHILEPFVTHRKEGLGLGLTVCQTIVEAHGRTVSAENNSDRGATFRVVLPAVRHDVLIALG
jgi:C4-dicarboxylate-specific signal transduction histidine kinase